MPRKRNSVPKYTLHKPSGQARARVGNRDYWLGVHGSPESLRRYSELLAELAGRTVDKPVRSDPLVTKKTTVKLLVERYQKYLSEKWRRRDEGRGITSRSSTSKRVLSLLVDHCGDQDAAKFGPQALDQFRRVLIDLNWTRNYINKSIRQVIQCWRWAAGLAELVPADTASRLILFPALARLESRAIESEPVHPAQERSIAAAIDHSPPAVAAMIRLQLATGMRPGEVCAIRPCDIDRSGRIPLPGGDSIEMPGIWVYRPQTHKNTHRGHTRIVLIGPTGQAVLAPYLDRPADQHCFQPRESTEWHRERRRATRKTKVYPSWEARKIKLRVAKRSRPWGEWYTSGTYSQAVERSLERARKALSPGSPQIEDFTPHQLRHNAATRIGAEFGAEVARIVLGHRTLDVTRVYMDDDLRKAAEAMRKAG